jgi:Uma2 family endonuclease
MPDPARKRATYQDVIDAPAHLIAEIVDGELYTHPRPSRAHAEAASVLGMELGPAYHRGRGGPGGWIILDEPELHLGSDVLVPDLAGWRRERADGVPPAELGRLAPDWVCEVASPSTALLDRQRKLPIYARESVSHVWIVDPRVRLLEVLRLDGGGYRLVATYGEREVARAEPFEAVELELEALWPHAADEPQP